MTIDIKNQSLSYDELHLTDSVQSNINTKRVCAFQIGDHWRIECSSYKLHTTIEFPHIASNLSFSFSN